jgi:diguanylate cyclase (GGDEF)-like protein/PAS domain S-box-containing protein
VLVLFANEVIEVSSDETRLLQELANDVAFGIGNLRALAMVRDQAALLDKAQDAIIVRGMDDRVLFWNHSAERLYGWTAQEAIGTVMWDRQDPVAFHGAMQEVTTLGSWTGEIQQRRKDGSVLTVEARWTLVRDDQGQPQSILAINTDITERKAAERKIQRLAFYDPLTQLPNRLLLMDRLQHTLAGAARARRCGALLFIDLDNFKTLNDTLGHEKGDILLQQVAVRLGTCVREADTVARFGGDEFVVVLEDLGEVDAEAASKARAIGEKVLVELARPYLLDSYEYSSSSSIGIAPFGQQHEGASELLKQADLAMYQAKTAGRNAMRFFDPSMQAIVNARVQMEAEMRQALAQQEYVLHYQPQFDGTGQVTGVEALLRWRHPQRGPVSPAEFIPLAEETGIIIPLGQWVLQTACTQLNAWRTSDSTAHLTMAVNVSARQFHSVDFVEQVTQVLRDTGVDARKLKLELTESMLVDDLELTISKMTELKAMGVYFSLDDFGTGYSSLSYLKRLPLDQLKIDQSFVRDIITDMNDASIVRTVIALGQSLGLAVIAEGVETAAQRDFLASHGCLAYQGYLFSRPLPIQELQAFLLTAAHCQKI